jgi:hypothetical protein
MLYMSRSCANEVPRGRDDTEGPKYLPNGQLLDLPVGAGSTRSCNLYPSGNFGDEFLRSARIFHFDACLPQLGIQLGWGLEMDPSEAQAAGGFYIG